MANVSNSVDVFDRCFVIIWGQDLTILSDFDPDFFKSNAFGLSTSSDGKQDSVKSVLDFVLPLLEGDYFFALWI